MIHPQPASAKIAGKTCPYCQTQIDLGVPSVVCTSCYMPHHHDCWMENGGCTTFGCVKAPGYRQQPFRVNPAECVECGYMLQPFDSTCPRCEEHRRSGTHRSQPVGGRAIDLQPESRYPQMQPISGRVVDTQPVRRYPHMHQVSSNQGPNQFGYQDMSQIRGWNWGAFALTPIWLLAMNQAGWFFIWLFSLWCGYGVLPLIVHIYLGVKGSEMAWQSRQWQSMRHFQETQRVWIAWGQGVFVVAVTFYVIRIINAIFSTY